MRYRLHRVRVVSPSGPKSRYVTDRSTVAGFTLIETLVAFAILTLALTVVFGGLTRLMIGGHAAEMKRAALRLAQGYLDEAGISDPLAAQTTGRSPEGFRWLVIGRPMSVASTTKADAAWIEVSVWVPGSRRERPDVSLATLRLLRSTP